MMMIIFNFTLIYINFLLLGNEAFKKEFGNLKKSFILGHVFGTYYLARRMEEYFEV